MKLFRGYIPCNSDKTPKNYYNPRTKHSISKRKGIADEELLTLQEVQHFDNYAGLLSEDTVLVDVDNKPESKILLNIVKDLKLKCKVIETNKGMHFYFKKPANFEVQKQKIGILLRIGIEADFLFTTERYAIIKQNNKVRETIYEADEIGELPFYLFPIPRTDKAKRFSELHEGSRNESLFSYQILLFSNGLNEAEVREIITIINTYVLPEPLPLDEIKVCQREEALKGAKEIVESSPVFNPTLSKFLNGKKIKTDDYAIHLIEKLHIIKINTFLYVYVDGIYRPNLKTHKYITNYIAKKEFPNLTQNQHNEILYAIDRQIMDDSEEAPLKYIAVKNGYIEAKEMNPIDGSFTLHPHNPNVIFTQSIPWDYDPSAPTKPWEDLFMTYANGHLDLYQLLREMLAIAIYRSANEGIEGKCFILTGSGSNGKSAFINIIKKFLSKENYSNVLPQQFGWRFALSDMEGKLANLVSDLNEGAIESSGLWKSVVSGDSINTERKNEHAFSFSPYATQIYSCNNIPYIKDDSNGVARRLIIIPFDKIFKPEEADKNIVSKYTTPIMMSGLLNFILPALSDLLNRNGVFTYSEISNNLVKEYTSEASSIMGFINYCRETNFDYIGMATGDVYDHYKTYCLDNGIDAYANNIFFKKFHLNANTCNKRIRDGYSLIQIVASKERNL